MTLISEVETKEDNRLNVASAPNEAKNSLLVMTQDVVKAWEETLVSLNLYLRSKSNKVNTIFFMVLVVSFFLLIMFAMSSGGLLESLVQIGRNYGSSSSSTTSIVYATSYVRDIISQDVGYLGAAVFAGAMLSAIVAPFTGTSSLTFISKKETGNLLNSRMKPYTDSVLSALLSIITPLQVLSLTMISSLILIAGGDAKLTFMATWLISLTILNLNVMFIWVEKIISIKKNGRYSKLIAASIIAVLGLMVIVDPQHGRNAFGLSDLFFDYILGSANASTGEVASFVGVIFITNFVLIVSTILLASSAINSSYFTTRGNKTHIGDVSLESMDKTLPPRNKILNNLNFITILLSPFKYYASYRSPFIILVSVGILATFITKGMNNAIVGETLIIPLIIALGWSSNVLGIVGGGLSWIMSFPNVKNRFVATVFLTHIAAGLAMIFAILLPSVIFGYVDGQTLLSALLTNLTAGAIVGAFSVSKSFKSPHSTSLGSGAETILPPATTLVYTMQIVLITLLPSLLVFYSGNLFYIQIGLTGLAVMFSSFHVMRINKQWINNPELIKSIINKVTQD